MKKQKNSIRCWKRIVSGITLLCCTFNCPLLGTNADEAIPFNWNPWFGYKLNADLNTAKCYYPDEIAPTYGITIMRGATAWNTAANPMSSIDVYWSREPYSYNYEQGNACVKVWAESRGLNNQVASTRFYYSIDELENDERRNPNYGNWDFCGIVINTDYNADYITMTHEFGHVMGLTDNKEDTKSIMYYIRDEREATKPAMVDILALNRLYLGLI